MAAVRKKLVEEELAPAPKLNPRQLRLLSQGATGEDWTQITHYDPNRKYVWAFTGDRTQGVTYYESLGYNPEVKTANGVRALMASRKLQEGEEIIVRDHLLMSISKEMADEIEEWGASGDSGLSLADKLERRMTGGKNPKATDHRGLKPEGNFNRQHFQFARMNSGEDQ